MGGQNHRFEVVYDQDSTEILDGDTWRFTSPLPSARFGLRAASVANRIYVFGKNTVMINYFQLKIFQVDLTSPRNTWTRS